MHIVFLIGNGFDISLGLKTRYTDFYKYYTRLTDTEPCIRKLKQTIKTEGENWSDFEKAFGIYTQNIATQEDLDILYDDILLEMQKYLQAETEKLADSSMNTASFIESLTKPNSFIREQRRIQHLFSDAGTDVNIINFNYTKTIDIFVANAISNLKFNLNTTINTPQHIHGILDGTMLFGVNDKSQIANTVFQNDDTIVFELVKPLFNKKLGYGTDSVCLSHIYIASLICIFGMSIGDTDQYWWTTIGDRMKQDLECHVILFYWDGKLYKPINERYKIRKEDEIKEMFLQKIGVDKDSKDIVDRIFIGYNTPIFQNIIEK